MFPFCGSPCFSIGDPEDPECGAEVIHEGDPRKKRYWILALRDGVKKNSSCYNLFVLVSFMGVTTGGGFWLQIVREGIKAAEGKLQISGRHRKVELIVSTVE